MEVKSWLRRYRLFFYKKIASGASVVGFASEASVVRIASEASWFHSGAADSFNVSKIAIPHMFLPISLWEFK